MQKILNILFILSTMAALQGCSKGLKNSEKQYVYLSEERFSELNPSDVTEIYVVLAFDRENPAMWEREYPSVFPIKDPENIKKIIHLISTADRILPFSPPDGTFWAENLVLETVDIIYHTGVSLGAENAGGDWWQSEELLTFLYSLGLPHPEDG